MAQEEKRDPKQEKAAELLESIESVVGDIGNKAMRAFNSSATLPSVVREIVDFLDKDATAGAAVKSIERIKPRTLRKGEIISTLGVRG